jgi:1-acyl-sn-glycerol-3-phosphate acyltransferase
MTRPRRRSSWLPGSSPHDITADLVYFKPWRLITAPKLYGLRNIPDERALLFVGNHTLMGLLDAPMLFAELLARRGIFLHGLGDHVHFTIPIWRDLLRRFGVVDGSRENCAALMRAGESVLVFPGGGREVAKRKGEKYQLMWKERIGFARLAIQHSYPIVPFASVGAEEAWDILIDANDIMATPVGRLIDRLGWRTDVLLPIVRGIGPTPLPRPERLYFRFMPPIDTRAYRGRHHSRRACFALREEVKVAIECGIQDLLRRRDKDPQRELLPRLIGQLEKAAQRLSARP